MFVKLFIKLSAVTRLQIHLVTTYCKLKAFVRKNSNPNFFQVDRYLPTVISSPSLISRFSPHVLQGANHWKAKLRNRYSCMILTFTNIIVNLPNILQLHYNRRTPKRLWNNFPFSVYPDSRSSKIRLVQNHHENDWSDEINSFDRNQAQNFFHDDTGHRQYKSY